MTKMKDSGVKWIGQIPESWKVCKYKYFATSGMGETILRENLVENGLPVYSATQDDSIFGYVNDSKINLNPGDLVIPARGNSIGCVTLLKENATCTQTTIYSKIRNINNKFLYYCANGLKEHWFKYEDTAIPQITVSQIQENYVPLPSNEIQKRIADFLDKKCEEIDELIAIQEKEIEKLKEYKTSVITKAVTKGLDDSVLMKDSGIDWIGQIPEHWITIKIKFTSWLKGRIGWDGLKSSEFCDDGPYLITGTDFENGKINWYSCAHISLERFMEDILLHIQEDDLLITKDGTIGKLAIVQNCPQQVSLNSGVMIIRNNSKWKYKNKFLYYILSSNQFYLWYEMSQNGNSTIRHLYQGQFYDFEFTYPSIDEQNLIINYLEKKCEEVDFLIGFKKQKIQRLQEYKKSLIYEYVTGKKEVI